MSKNYYLSGQWNVTCDVCSKKIKSSDARHRWDGLITCSDCWEQRQPLDFIRARTDKIAVPFQRPIPTLEFVPQDFEERLADSVITDESLQRTAVYIRSYGDTVAASDHIDAKRGYDCSDAVGTSENFEYLRSVTFADNVSVFEAIGCSTHILKTDLVDITDAASKGCASSILDTTIIIDAVTDALHLNKSDSIYTTDTVSSVSITTGAINAILFNSAAINATTINQVIAKTASGPIGACGLNKVAINAEISGYKLTTPITTTAINSVVINLNEI